MCLCANRPNNAGKRACHTQFSRSEACSLGYRVPTNVLACSANACTGAKSILAAYVALRQACSTTVLGFLRPVPGVQPLNPVLPVPIHSVTLDPHQMGENHLSASTLS